MKTIALLPVKNESWILPTYLSSIKNVVDEIIAIDDGSTDNSKNILESAGAIVYSNTEKVQSGWAEYSIRERLLSLGREHGGTHFVCLDADEAFSKKARENIKKNISKLMPGQKMNFLWSLIWGNLYEERIDGIFKNVYKDFIFCDDGKTGYSYAFLGVSRCPDFSNHIQPLKMEAGSVLHFQSLDLSMNMLKQAWYMCSELIKKGRSAKRINAMYSTMLNFTKIKKRDIPTSEFQGIILPKENSQIKNEWHYKEIIKWFDEYGILSFEPLEIWHIKDLHDDFLQKIGREPKPKTFPKFLIKLNDIKNRIKNLM